MRRHPFIIWLPISAALACLLFGFVALLDRLINPFWLLSRFARELRFLFLLLFFTFGPVFVAITKEAKAKAQNQVKSEDEN